MKDTCASCGQKIYNSKARFSVKGNYCDACNARASFTAKSRQYKESYRHAENKAYNNGEIITVKDIMKLRKRFTEDLDFPRGQM